ncbi:MAG: SGNH/GDSL hydrolase family protein [Halioglobus sp.]
MAFRLTKIPKYWVSIMLAVAMFIALELALQARSQLRYGTSIFNLVNDESIYVSNEELGIKLLRANSTIDGTQATIVTNALGLRNAAIANPKPAGLLRVAVVGASSVMGSYTRNNDDTLSARLQEKFPNYYSDAPQVEFINAGIAGYSLPDQQVLLENILMPLGLDAIVLYPGFNDLSAYCGSSETETAEDYRLFDLSLPKWLLSIELITKNTVALREVKAGGAKYLNALELDTNEYESTVNEFFAELSNTGLPVLVLTNPRAYSREMPEAEQRTLSETARFYSPCFDVNGLHDLFDNHNAILANAAKAKGFEVFPLDREMPKGSDNFGDATHFSVVGTDRAADLIAPALARYLSTALAASPAAEGNQ